MLCLTRIARNTLVSHPWRPLSLFPVVSVKQSLPITQTHRRPITCSTRLLTRAPSAIAQRLPDPERSPHRFRDFDLQGKVFVVTGGGRGLGLTLAEVLVEAGGKGE